MNPWLILCFVLSLIAAYEGGEWRGDAKGAARVQQLWDKDKAAQAEQYAKDQAAARDKEQILQAEADRIRKEKDEQIRNSEARATALANSLRNRPEQPTQGGAGAKGANAGQAAAGCNGTGLYRQDAEFLAREAARANQLRAALKECYGRIDSVTAGQN